MTDDRTGTVDGYSWKAHFYRALAPMPAEVEFEVTRPDRSVFYMSRPVQGDYTFDDVVDMLEQRLIEIAAVGHA